MVKPENTDSQLQKKIRMSALDLLARREHGHVELNQKLMKRINSEERMAASHIVHEVVAGLAQEGLQSDFRFASSFIRSRVYRRQGLERIKQELRYRGVSDDVIDEAISENETDWFDLALQSRLKRFGASMPQDQKSRLKQQRFLQYRGFSFEQIHYAMTYVEK